MNGWRVVLQAVTVGVCGCGAQEPPNGTYRASTTTITDTCMPAACEGDNGNVAITSSPDASINLPVTHCFGGRREFATVYHRLPAEYAVRDSCGGIIGRESITVEELGPPFVVHISTVLDAGECVSDGGVVFGGVWPASPCSVEQRVTFALVQDCQPPCSLRLVAPDRDSACECP